MNDYNTLRHLADTVGLTAMAVLFVVLCFWPFRPGSKGRNQQAASSIFEEPDDGE